MMPMPSTHTYLLFLSACALLFLGSGCDFFEESDELSCDATVRYPAQKKGTWQQLNVPDGEVRFFEPHACNANVAYVITANPDHSRTVYRTDDMGQAWKPIYSSSNSLWKIVTHAARPEDIFVLSEGLVKSSNGGQHWRVLAPDSLFGPSLTAAWSLIVSNYSVSRFFLGTGGVISSWPAGGVFRSDNSGKTWFSVPERDAHVSLSNGVSDLIATDHGIYALALLDGQLLFSADEGESWLILSEADDIAIAKDAPERMVVRVCQPLWKPDESCFRFSTDAGRSWQPIAARLPGSGQLSNLAISPDGDQLYISIRNAHDTQINGLYRLTSGFNESKWVLLEDTAAPVGRLVFDASGTHLFGHSSSSVFQFRLE